MNEKLARIKNKLKERAPEIITVASSTAAFVAVVYAIKEVNSARASVAKANKDLDEATAFLGKGPDFIAFDEELSTKIDEGKVYEYDLVTGVRIAIMKAHEN